MCTGQAPDPVPLRGMKRATAGVKRECVVRAMAPICRELAGLEVRSELYTSPGISGSALRCTGLVMGKGNGDEGKIRY